MRLRTRWEGLPPERKKALVLASVLVLGTALLFLGLLSEATWLALPGALALFGAAGGRVASLDGLIPYSALPKWLKIAYWVLWVMAWPLLLLVLEAAVWIKVWELWQSAPVLTRARIAKLEQQLARPTED